MSSTLILILLTCSSGASFAKTSKQTQFPHLVSVRVKQLHICGGSIVSPNRILTAASCILNGLDPIPPSDVTVRAGSINQYGGGKIYNVTQIRTHPYAKNFMYDMAILLLETTLKLGSKVKVIELSNSEGDIEVGANVTVPGWRANQWDIHLSTLKIESSSWCEDRIGFGHPSVLCMSHELNQGTCRGDFGSGVVLRGKLIAVSSFAFGSCGTKYPDVFSGVHFFRRWIGY